MSNIIHMMALLSLKWMFGNVQHSTLLIAALTFANGLLRMEPIYLIFWLFTGIEDKFFRVFYRNYITINENPVSSGKAF